MPLLKLVPDNTNIDFMRWRNIALVISILLTVASIALVAVKGLNFGVDFVGGQSIQVAFKQEVKIEDMRSLVAGLEVGDANIQQFGGPKGLQIKLGPPEGNDAEVATAQITTKIRTAISKAYPGAQFLVESVTPKVGDELYRDGAISIALSMLGIAIYIWFRFEWQFGVGALVTLGHDVAMTLGFFSLTGLEFDLNVVAAILTIVGYSLNDTVVIYDRIRENLRKYRKMETVPLLNLSLNETLSRTIVTSLSIMMALAMLVLIGPEVIFGLSIAILLGIFVGTYSSIYISSPILVWLGVGPDSFVSASGPAERTVNYNEGP
jgi:preprotein translocase subunit SecF